MPSYSMRGLKFVEWKTCAGEWGDRVLFWMA